MDGRRQDRYVPRQGGGIGNDTTLSRTALGGEEGVEDKGESSDLGEQHDCGYIVDQVQVQGHSPMDLAHDCWAMGVGRRGEREKGRRHSCDASQQTHVHVNLEFGKKDVREQPCRCPEPRSQVIVDSGRWGGQNHAERQEGCSTKPAKRAEGGDCLSLRLSTVGALARGPGVF